MPSLNLDVNYFEHVKTQRLVAALGIGSEVFPIRLWCFVGKHYPETGDLPGLETGELENLLGWRGEAGRCVEALIKVGFLERIKRGFRVHDWKEHSGHLAAFKTRASRAAKARWAKLGGDATSMQQASLEQCPSRTKPTNPPNPRRGGQSRTTAADAGKDQDPEAAKLRKWQGDLAYANKQLADYAKRPPATTEDQVRKKDLEILKAKLEAALAQAHRSEP